MKLAIPVKIKDENSRMYERFGRSIYYAIYDKDTDNYEFVTNPASDARGGAGVQAVQFLVSKDVKAVVAPQLGPNADNALRRANVEVFQGEAISVKELVEKWKNNQLQKI
ncbi:MAG: NifB/NifX family molybdenum-iron cluster-binding protein [Candidatus Heimdallarchaeaceae archaeon]